MARIIRTDGTEEDLADTSLESLQKACGGYIETIRINGHQLMIVDEEGRCKCKQINERASTLVSPRGIDYIVGDVVVAEDSEVK